MRQSNIKTPLVFKIGILLLCAMLLTSYMMSGLYARYTVTATASDSARVARFSIESDLETQSQKLVITASEAGFYPGQTIGEYITINNRSEVTVKYSVTTENLTGNLPVVAVIQGNTNGILAPGEVGSGIFLSLTWSDIANAPDYAGKMDIIRITVTVEQVD